MVEEIPAYPNVDDLLRVGGGPALHGLFIPIRIESGGTEVSWLTTILTIGGAIDVTLDDLVIECFFPADAGTDSYLQSQRPV